MSLTQPIPTAIDPSLYRKKIIHIDMDCFYAAVEIRDNPKLKGLPIVVGGAPKSRSVVTTASYEARVFGIHSAMPCSHAYQKCPHAIFLAPRIAYYRQISHQIKDIFKRFTTLVEPVSLDEAYLDVTEMPEFATAIAKKITATIRHETGLSASAGVAPNKLLAKIASDFQKPGGLTVVRPENALQFMRNLPLRKVPGVGPVTDGLLKAIGCLRCSDIEKIPRDVLIRTLGQKRAQWLTQHARGIDPRPVRPHWQRKSLGHEETYSTDLNELAIIREKVEEITKRVCEDLEKKQLRGRTITLKVKFSDFKQLTRRKTLQTPTCQVATVTALSLQLFRQLPAPHKNIRLLGVSLSNFNTVIDSGQILLPGFQTTLL